MRFKVATRFADLILVIALQVVAWRRFGYNRLYVNTPSGERVGWFDLATERAVVEIPQFHDEFRQAVDRYLEAYAGKSQDAQDNVKVAHPRCDVHHPLPKAIPELSQPNWTDLSLNRPGQGIRRIARQRWDADPLGNLKDELGGIYTEERSYRIGADGEEVVGLELSALPLGWHAIHSIPVGHRGADIDHAVIGPAGVFTVNTKHHPQANVWVHGKIVRVNQKSHPYVARSQSEATRASRLLSQSCGFFVPCIAILAMVGAKGGIRVKTQPAGGSVVVMDYTRLLDWLLAQERTLSGAQVELIFDRARRSTTWATGSRPASAAAAVRR